MLETLSQAAGYGRETRTVTALRGIELHHVTECVTTKGQSMHTDFEIRQQTATAAARVERASRDHLEAIESAARAYFAARRDGTRPQVVQARERLRLMLAEDAPPVWPPKPWA
jgi:hypothetical protein